MLKKRPIGLVMIVIYKSFVAGLMATTAIALWLTLKNHQQLEQFSQSYLLETKAALINWVLEKVLSLDPKTLEYGGLGAACYAGLTVIEAIGLWYEQAWAEVLVILLVAMSIPLEALELLRGFSWMKLIIFTINMGVLGYLVGQFIHKKCQASKRVYSHFH